MYKPQVPKDPNGAHLALCAVRALCYQEGGKFGPWDSAR